MVDATKVKPWWSEDGKWFCLLVDDGVNKATVSLTPDEARALGDALADRAATAAPSAEEIGRVIWGHFGKMGGAFEYAKGTVAYDHVMGCARAILALAPPCSPDKDGIMSYLDELPTEKLLAHLLREARHFVNDAGDDEDPEAKRHATELVRRIDAALLLSRFG